MQAKISARYENDCLPSLVNVARMFKEAADRIVFLIAHVDVLDQEGLEEKNKVLR